MPTKQERLDNTKAVLNQHLLQMADDTEAAILSSRLDAISESRQDIAPAAGERSTAVVQRDVMQELRRCRAEHEKLRRDLATSLDVIDKRNGMLSAALDTIQQNGLTIPTGAKKFKKIKKSMKKSKRKSKGKGKSKGRSSRGSMRRRRR
tara:strand:- start:21 stop:467 length:447 start_codon:yes stop_codon:yes gene_type:complete